MLVIGAVVVVLYTASLARPLGGMGLDFGQQLFMQLLSLWPVFLVGAVIWFGRDVVASLGRIERALAAHSGRDTESIHGA